MFWVVMWILCSALADLLHYLIVAQRFADHGEQIRQPDNERTVFTGTA